MDQLETDTSNTGGDTDPLSSPPVAIDPTGSALFEEAARLRAEGPAVRAMMPGDIPVWYITSHQQLKALLTDDRVSKDPNQHWTAWQNGQHHDSWLVNWVAVTNMFTAYGKEHRSLRKLIAPAFTARRTAAMQPRVERITNELIEGLAATPAGQTVDLRPTYSHPLPMQVICELFGLPEESRDEMGVLVERIMDTTVTAEEAAETNQGLAAALSALIDLRRREPGEDLTSVLVAGRDEDGSKLSEKQLQDTLLLVLGAGHETTVNLIGNAVYALLTNPDQLQLVRDGERTWDDVIEETLRWAPSITNLPLRYAVEDIQIPDGPTIPKGEAILTTYGAAAHDPAKFGESVAEFDITRPTPEHLSFGFGVHHCLGAPLARMEARIALPALFDRFPDIHLAVPTSEIRLVESFVAHGLRELPVRLTR